MNSLAKAQARNGLWDQLWIVALDEAYTARDAARRMAALNGLAKSDVVEVYFAQHPEMRTWAEAHVAAGTCEQALHELEDGLAKTRKSRAEQRAVQANLAAKLASERCDPPSDADALDWMAAFRLGPARIPLQPQEEPLPTAKPQPTNPAVRQFMRERMETWPNDKPAPTESEDFAATLNFFAPGLTREEFRLVRDQETPPEWRKQGRRRAWGSVKNSAA